MNRIHKILQCCGTIDCTHLHFDLPIGGWRIDWFDLDHNHSMIFQVTVYSEMRFIDVFVRFPRLTHDARVFQCSKHNLLVQNRTRLNGPIREIEGGQVKKLIIGDTNYTYNDTVFTSYLGHNLPPLYDSPILKHLSTRMVVESTFGILKECRKY